MSLTVVSILRRVAEFPKTGLMAKPSMLPRRAQSVVVRGGASEKALLVEGVETGPVLRFMEGRSFLITPTQLLPGGKIEKSSGPRFHQASHRWRACQ